MIDSKGSICLTVRPRSNARLAYFAVCVFLSPMPAFAREAGLNLVDSSAGESSSLKAYYESGGRVLFIGSQPSAVPEIDGASVTVNRASDLVGTPITILKRFSDRRSYSAKSGALPQGTPVSSSQLTSWFGTRVHPILGSLRQHRGIDLAAREGSAVAATSDGTVGTAGWNGGYGLYVALNHGGGVQTRYAHLSRINVLAGQAVRKGDIIGFVGSTGRSTGPHLHYEVRINGQAINPASLLRGN